jgi:hypothetical protein
MNPEVKYQMSIARIEELHRQADASRLAAKAARVPHGKASRRQWRIGRRPRPSIAGRLAV